MLVNGTHACKHFFVLMRKYKTKDLHRTVTNGFRNHISKLFVVLFIICVLH